LLACQASATSGPAAPNRLAYVGLDDHVYVVAPDAGDPRRVSALPGEAPVPAGQRFARWPTWAPDGRQLAFMRFEVSQVEPNRAAVFTSSLDEKPPKRIWESSEAFPIYLAWTPDGGSLTLLTGRGSDSLSLWLLDSSAANGPRLLVEGGPIYFAWSPDGQRVLLHVNGDRTLTDRATLAMGRLSQLERPEPLASAPTAFRAPSWAPNGERVAFIASMPGGQAALAVQPSSATEPARIAVVGSDTAVLWSPTGDLLAFSTRAGDRPLLYHGLETVRPDGNDRRRVTEADLLGFAWSPDGKRLAFAALDLPRGALTWTIADADGRNQRQVASFAPSEDQLRMFAFFDQYAQSHALWSPDGRYLVYSGTPPNPRWSSSQPSLAPDAEDEQEPSTQIYIVPVDGSAPARALAAGEIASWPTGAPGRAR
jgi:TolB protein